MERYLCESSRSKNAEKVHGPESVLCLDVPSCVARREQRSPGNCRNSVRIEGDIRIAEWGMEIVMNIGRREEVGCEKRAEGKEGEQARIINYFSEAFDFCFFLHEYLKFIIKDLN